MSGSAKFGQAPDFLTAGVPPPTAFPFSVDDQIAVNVENSVASQSLAIQGRILRPTGEIELISEVMSPDSTRGRNELDINPGPGYLISLNIRATVNTRRGQCFVHPTVKRLGNHVALLFADYVTDLFAGVGFPGGRIISSVEGPGRVFSNTPANPAAGAEISVSVPTGARWKVRSVRASFTTNATVAARRVQLILDDGTNIYAVHPATSTQAASVSVGYAFLQGLPVMENTLNEFLEFMIPDIALPAAARIRTSTTNLQAGDQYSAIVMAVEEWIEQA